MIKIKGEYFGTKFLITIRAAHKEAILPHNPARNRKRVENTLIIGLKSVIVKLPKAIIEQKDKNPANKNVFHGTTLSISTPPITPEKYPNLTEESKISIA